MYMHRRIILYIHVDIAVNHYKSRYKLKMNIFIGNCT